MMKTVIRPAAVLFLLLTLACCVLYPAAVTGIGRLAFGYQAEGSLVQRDGRLAGSLVIGQAFSSPRYFWGRPSATSPMPDNAAASGASNFSQSNPAQIDAVRGRVELLRAADPGNALPVPVDLVTASASGLDPEISLAAAYYQAGRVARERRMAPDQVRALVDSHARLPWLGLFGEPRVNVLALNLALDAQ
jgi:K+-transporting ATPase ATPase C chain